MTSGGSSDEWWTQQPHADDDTVTVTVQSVIIAEPELALAYTTTKNN